MNRGRVSSWHIAQQTEQAVWIVDDDGALSVTNDAHEVVKSLFARFGNVRIYYRDSAGDWDELVHVRGRWASFAPARHMAIAV